MCTNSVVNDRVNHESHPYLNLNHNNVNECYNCKDVQFANSKTVDINNFYHFPLCDCYSCKYIHA